MDPHQAMPGDKIRIVYPYFDKHLGKKFIVQKPNRDALDWIGNYAWVRGPEGPLCFFGREYKIISREEQNVGRKDTEGQMLLAYQG